MWVVCFIVTLTFIFLRHVIFKNCKGKFAKIMDNIDEKLRWNTLLRGIFVSFLGLFLTSVITSSRFNVGKSAIETIDYFVSVLCTLFLLLIIFIIFSFMFKNAKKLSDSNFSKSFAPIAHEIKVSHYFKRHFMVTTLIRRVIFVLILVYFGNTPEL